MMRELRDLKQILVDFDVIEIALYLRMERSAFQVQVSRTHKLVKAGAAIMRF